MSPAEADTFCHVLQSGSLGNHAHVLAVLQRYGSLDYTRRRAEETLHTARAALRAFSPSPDRDLLDTLALWSLQRPC